MPIPLKYKAVICPRTGRLIELDPNYVPPRRESKAPMIITDKMDRQLVHPLSTANNIIATDSKSTFERITREAGYTTVGNEYDNVKWQPHSAENTPQIDWKDEIEHARSRLDNDFGGKIEYTNDE